jgi:hypothetical protein
MKPFVNKYYRLLNSIRQMNLYLNYFKTEENVEDNNEPIGIILLTEKDKVWVEFATG